MPDERDGRRWDNSTIVLHWLSAALLFAILGLGFVMVYADLGAAPKFDLYQLHKSLGFVALALVLLRIERRLTRRKLADPATSSLRRISAALVHLALYALMLGVAFSGWLFVSAAIIPIPTRFFRLFVVPNLVAPNAALANRMASLHLIASWLILILVLLHVAAALKHHFIDRDDVLKGMMSLR